MKNFGYIEMKQIKDTKLLLELEMKNPIQVSVLGCTFHNTSCLTGLLARRSNKPLKLESIMSLNAQFIDSYIER